MSDVIHREGPDILMFMIVADDLDRRSVGVEVDGVRVEFALFDLAAVERPVPHQDTASVDVRARQPVNRPGVGREVFGGRGGRAVDVGHRV